MPSNPTVNDFEDLMTHLYRQIKQMIYDNILSPGTKIKQEHLAQMLGVSRTPLIKVLQRLTSEHLVEYVPRRGFYVKKLTAEEMLEIFAIREVMEGVAAKIVAEKATEAEIEELAEFFRPYGNDWDEEKKSKYRISDQKFHARMLEIAGNNLLMEMNETFNIHRFAYQKGLMRHPGETLSEHLDIIRAIGNRDPQAAQLLAISHIEKSRQNITRVFEERGNVNGEFKW